MSPKVASYDRLPSPVHNDVAHPPAADPSSVATATGADTIPSRSGTTSSSGAVSRSWMFDVHGPGRAVTGAIRNGVVRASGIHAQAWDHKMIISTATGLSVTHIVFGLYFLQHAWSKTTSGYLASSQPFVQFPRQPLAYVTGCYHDVPSGLVRPDAARFSRLVTPGVSLILGLLTRMAAFTGWPVEDGSAMQRLGRGGG